MFVEVSEQLGTVHSKGTLNVPLIHLKVLIYPLKVVVGTNIFLNVVKKVQRYLNVPVTSCCTSKATVLALFFLTDGFIRTLLHKKADKPSHFLL